MWWKYYLCTDPIVFRFEPTEFSDGHLQWAIDVHPRFQQRGTLSGSSWIPGRGATW